MKNYHVEVKGGTTKGATNVTAHSAGEAAHQAVPAVLGPGYELTEAGAKVEVVITLGRVTVEAEQEAWDRAKAARKAAKETA